MHPHSRRRVTTSARPGLWRRRGCADARRRQRALGLRADSGGENCTGAITAEGDVAFPSPALRSADRAGVIEVTPAQWTPYTNVEVFLRVREGSFNINATMMGHFDGIVLEATDAPGGLLFADGFE